jgi:hypothetical protein
LPTTISIDSITTEDAAPSAAPHRISSQAGWSTLTVQFTPTHDGAIVPSADLLPTDGTIFPDENYYPDDGWYPDEGAIEPGVARDIIGWTIRENGSDPTSGRVIAQNVGRCSSARVCGSRAALNNACSRESKARTPSGQQIATTFAYADANDGGGDGSRNVNVWALTESQGWS